VLPDNQLDERFYSRAYPRPLEAAVLVDAIQDVTGVSEEFDGHHVRRAVHVVDAAVPASTLDSLGRCPGTAACKSTNGELHLSAQLTLLNGQVINQKLRAPTGRLQTQIQAKLTIPQIVSEWYWVALSRPASTDEQRFWIEALSDDDLEQQNKRVEDFVWSLLNSRAFIER
jgi:hypothetical protein